MINLRPGGEGKTSGHRLPAGKEEPYASPQPVDFRGDFKPELVQLLMRLRLQEGAQAPEGMAALTAEQLRELMEKSVEISIGAMSEGDLSSAFGMFLTKPGEGGGGADPGPAVEAKDGQPAGETAV